MIIIGIDPGSVVCGYGVIEKQKSVLRLVEYGVIQPKKKNENFNLRLLDIFERLKRIVETNKPDFAAFESLFFGKNIQSLIKLSHARSAAIIAALTAKSEIVEYSPREIKKSVTGRGNASKEQVMFMVKSILKISETPEFFDATDALATALCHSFRSNENITKVTNWEDFINKNPHRIVQVNKNNN
ncbi:MAG: crossover junction endodeoxyribonuclease RuvC [Candidatus Kapabacteria bacterium]|nr:crossover junction endodeoxyribonuclease RuvC [Candidatus Kapabacteria bacterium]